MSDKMREEFEEWFSCNYKWFIEKDMGGYSLARFPEGQMQYIDQIPHHDWRVWQASRAALVVELPPSMGMPDEDELDYEEFEAMEAITCTANGMRHACRNAIHAAGVKTK